MFKEKFRIEAEAPSSNDKIWIGPPDPVSNIRPVKFPDHPDESSIEYKFYKQQAETIQWNQDFWSKHNTKFFKVYKWDKACLLFYFFFLLYVSVLIGLVCLWRHLLMFPMNNCNILALTFCCLRMKQMWQQCIF